MEARATEKGGLFKSIQAEDITQMIGRETGMGIPDDALILEDPIKSTGEHTLVFKAAGVEAKVTLKIKPRN